MTQTKSEPTDGGKLSRLAERGEEALRRLYDELDRNERTHDALERLVAARGRLDQVQRSVLSQLNVAPADEIVKLREQVARVEQRLAKLEAAAKTPARRAARKPAPSEPASEPPAG